MREHREGKGTQVDGVLRNLDSLDPPPSHR
jgi:hypothetical protein